MAKLTWLGAKDDQGEPIPPDALSWNGVDFPRDQAVDVTDETMIRKAKGNRFFKVEGEGEHPLGPLKPEAWTNDPSPEARRGGGKRPARVREEEGYGD